jgi:hypothetical protein
MTAELMDNVRHVEERSRTVVITASSNTQLTRFLSKLYYNHIPKRCRYGVLKTLRSASDRASIND